MENCLEFVLHRHQSKVIRAFFFVEDIWCVKVAHNSLDLPLFVCYHKSTSQVTLMKNSQQNIWHHESRIPSDVKLVSMATLKVAKRRLKFFFHCGICLKWWKFLVCRENKNVSKWKIHPFLFLAPEGFAMATNFDIKGILCCSMT